MKINEVFGAYASSLRRGYVIDLCLVQVYLIIFQNFMKIVKTMNTSWVSKLHSTNLRHWISPCREKNDVQDVLLGTHVSETSLKGWDNEVHQSSSDHAWHVTGITRRKQVVCKVTVMQIAVI